MLTRANARLFGQDQNNAAGYRTLSGRRRVSDATAASITWPVNYVLAGWIDRSGPGAGYGDTTPSVDQILAAVPDLTRGDTFDLVVTSSVAFANTIVAGTGVTLAGTTAVAASSMRMYQLTLTSEPKRTRVFSASTTNASANLTNIALADLQNVGVGMVVTGTNIAGGTTIVAVDLTNLRVVMSANATGTADNVAVTATPQMEMRGMWGAGN